MATSSSLKSLFKRLGQIDQERRQILTSIHNSKEYLQAYIDDYLKNLVKAKEWYVLKGKDGKIDLTDHSKILSIIEGTVNASDGFRGSQNKTDFWVSVKYKTLAGGTVLHKHKISTKNDLKPQIFQNLQELTDKEYKGILKVVKEQEAREEKQKKIDALNTELKKLTEQIAKLQQEIQK